MCGFSFRIPFLQKPVHNQKSPLTKKNVIKDVQKNVFSQFGPSGRHVLPLALTQELTGGSRCRFATEPFWLCPRVKSSKVRTTCCAHSTIQRTKKTIFSLEVTSTRVVVVTAAATVTEEQSLSTMSLYFLFSLLSFHTLWHWPFFVRGFGSFVMGGKPKDFLDLFEKFVLGQK